MINKGSRKISDISVRGKIHIRRKKSSGSHHLSRNYFNFKDCLIDAEKKFWADKNRAWLFAGGILLILAGLSAGSCFLSSRCQEKNVSLQETPADSGNAVWQEPEEIFSEGELTAEGAPEPSADQLATEKIFPNELPSNSPDNSSNDLPNNSAEKLAAESAENTAGENSNPVLDIFIKILDKGAPNERVNQTKNFLSDWGYPRVEAGKGEKPEALSNAVFFKEEKFRLEAESIAQFLRESEEIFSYARPAGTEEEKSADIVVVLGKSKEAPPN